MRKVVVSEFISLDGVCEAPMWTFEFGTDEQNNFKFNEMKNGEGLLLGRKTYEGFAEAWPNMIEQTGEYGVWMNNCPKYIVSSTLDKADWGPDSHVIRDNIAEEINKLKEQPGKDILVFGSLELIKTLIQLDLIDEYRLMTYPVVLGSGQRLFPEGMDKIKLKLEATETFPTGVVTHTYSVVR
ncbi:dihydrofolate reductase [Cohnella pontilimi]|uniref:Dihydrofolate reductase n=1 Tax=Cohnella pontilimi TaxID=2564100 RepID=A0A4U0F9A2_9BACL|nr:dihydrofolate reductase family protein [Cohnella pontilimi]TJY41336.1 dihydrofolate reductase [Cohnella pontilimi]